MEEKTKWDEIGPVMAEDSEEKRLQYIQSNFFLSNIRSTQAK